MKTIRLFIIAAVTLLCTTYLSIACSEKAQDEAKQAVETTEGDLQKERDEFIRDAEAKVAEFNRHLDTLKAKAEKAGADTKGEIDQQVQELERQLAEANRKLTELRTASKEAWGDMKTGVQYALDDLGKAFERVGERFN